ncbi:MAG: 2-hydroxyacid dehydrogenase [Candidatus Kariarchaeaceae archaeon]|jgi:phosphoglycerate dehydrogenase-like enzyme
MKVLFQSQGLITEGYKRYFREQLPEDIKLIFPNDTSKETLLEQAPNAEVFVGYMVTEEFMKTAIALRHIQVPWTGSDRLGFKLLKTYPQVTVSNSHSNSLSIAEHAVSLLFSAAKKIVYRDQHMRKGDWTPRYEDTNSYWLTGKTLGIIGYGAIGMKVAKMLKYGFNMQIQAIKRNPPEKSDDLCDFIGGQEDLIQVLESSDFLLIAVPMTTETKGMIGEKELAKMKNSVIIANIARGGIIDEEALYYSLKNHKIGAAGLDVWYNYPENKDSAKGVFQNFPFEELENVVLSPHSAFKVRDREEIFAEDIIENILRVYREEEPINQLNLDLGY